MTQVEKAQGRSSNGASCAATAFAHSADKLEPIAVIGFSMRFPEEATSPEGFWKILLEARSVMTEVPTDRFNINGFYHPDASRADTINCRGGHFMKDDIAAFDAPFFSLNPTEVESMDPQQRCLLETSYHALENAGIPIEKAAGSKTSVYVGSGGVQYNQFIDGDEEINPTYKAPGTSNAILSNRLSWFYDLNGPSMTIETACSSSMIALHLACQSLRSRESRMSLVCGSQLYFEPLTSAIPLSTLRFMSPDSRCFPFDKRANGYAKGEGFGVLVLKPLSEALAAADTIRAVIRASATNQDGRTPSLMQPSPAAQEDQIREAYEVGGLDLQSTRLFEAHGTGTVVGDPIEAQAIGAVFKDHRSREQPMYVGAVKSNIGHLEAAAGIAGVIKSIICLESGIIPPNAGFEELNENIHSDKWHLSFPTKPIPWPTPGLRRVSVNSFGYGGSNAHVVLDDAYNYLKERHLQGNHSTVERPPDVGAEIVTGIWSRAFNGNNHAKAVSSLMGAAREPYNAHANGEVNHKTESSPFIFTWSSSEAAGMLRLGSLYMDYLSQLSPTDHTPSFLHDLAYTLASRRSVLPWKSYVLAGSVKDLQAALESPPTHLRSYGSPNIHFIFTGQGAQWAKMGLELLVFPEFRQSLMRAEDHFKSLGATWSLTEEMERPAESSRLDSPALAQPICTALQVALVELLSSLDIHPWGIVGHSSGEIAAAFCAGAISDQYAWAIAYLRGTLAARLAGADDKEQGAMMSVQLSEAELEPYLKQVAESGRREDLAVGCENSPSNVTVTGLESSVKDLKCRLDRDGIFSRTLKTPVAYHSPHMKAVAAEYLDLLRAAVPPQPPVPKRSQQIFVSSVTGDYITLDQLCQPDYWVRNLVSRVKFSQAVRKLHSECSKASPSSQTWYHVEVGPHASLHRPTKDSVASAERFLYLSALRRGANAIETLANLVGGLFVGGYPVNVNSFNSHRSMQRSPRMLTNLPKYPFNHSQRYWLESRLFRNYRQRGTIRHELLGLPTSDWNQSKPRWRHTIRCSDLPWLEDHQINGSLIYPASGMLVMAIEAVRSISKPGQLIRGYRFRDVTVLNALVIPSEREGLEVQLHMQDQRNSRTTGSLSVECREFYLSSCSGNEWRDVCSGVIVTEYAKGSDGIYDAEQDALSHGDHIRERFHETAGFCSATNTREKIYGMGKKVGYDFGPTFQTLHEIEYDPAGKYATASISLDEWATKRPMKDVQEHIIHPTALDGVFQLTMVMSSKGGTVPNPPQAPSQITELWISHDLLKRKPNARLLVAAKMDRTAIRDIYASIVAVHPETFEPALFINGYRATSLASQDYRPSERRKIVYGIQWKPDVEILSRSDMEEYCLQEGGIMPAWDPSRKVMCLYYITQAIRELEGFNSSEPHLQKYMDWARHHLSELADQNPLFHSPWAEVWAPEGREQYISQLTARGAPERAIQIFCSQLHKIIRGEIDPLDLLFNQGLARDMYEDDVFGVMGRRAAAFIDLISHKNPNMDILEIGAGTGAVTAPILSAIGGESPTARGYKHYTFTDISPSFFAKAQYRFADYAEHMSFKTLDIEQDVAQQGFELSKYDVVIAGLVLHATANIQETLQHVKDLLKPGGCLVLLELTNQRGTVSDAVWGTLPGWWRGTEEDRQWGPLYSTPAWEFRLQQAGFDGFDLAISDYSEAESHMFSLLVSRLAPAPPNQSLPLCPMILSTGSELQQGVAAGITSYIESKGVSNCDTVNLKTALSRARDADLFICLLELEDSFLSSMSEEDLAILKIITDSSHQIYWISNGAGAEAPQPEKAMSSGFGRAIAQEHPGLCFVNIDVDDPAAAAGAFVKVFELSSALSDVNDLEPDYILSDGLLRIPRIVEACESNRFVHSQTGQLGLEKRTLGREPAKALELQFTFGLLDSFRFAPDKTVTVPLAEDEVEIEVKATGINFTDLMLILGQMAGAFIGYECSGIVRRVGSAVSSLSPGEPVCCMAAGTFRTFVRSKEYNVARIPSSLPFTDVFPAVYITVIYCIHHLGRLRKGESILIHAAAGAVGQVAIQLAQHAGADVFATVSSADKKDLIKRHYGIPENRILYSRNLAFGSQIMHATGGRGVDVILNSLSGEILAESWRTLAPLGRFVEIGKRDIHTFQSLPMQPFSKNVAYFSVDLETVERHRPDLMAQMVKEMENLLAAGTLSPPQPVSVFSRADFESALRYLQTGRHMGKAVIDWEAPAEVLVVPSPAQEYVCDPNASYVIAGGLGGIGRSLALWLAGRGAKHLILLSRTGPTSEAAIKLLGDLASRDVNIATPCCDIADAEALRGALGILNKSMPPVRGCIQSSMVLKDRMLQNMTKSEWQAVLDPKISGTWNLHNVLPRNMDFFVILSSSGGLMGSTGQSQYNAASTFQDAFARHRWSLGEHCAAIDVGVITGVGYLAERGDVAKRWVGKGMQVLSEDELRSIVDWACRPRRNYPSPWSTQIITGAAPEVGTGGEIDLLPHWKRPLYSYLRQDTEHATGHARAEKEKVDYSALLLSARDLDEACSIIATALAKSLSRALSVPMEDIDTTKPAHVYGVDSLVAIELRFWLTNEMKADISVFEILADRSIQALARLAAKKSTFVNISAT